MSETTEKIKERLSIVDVISSYIKLEKAGSNFKARCPFHHEKTPSFFISPARNTYYCFGCGEKGDIFSFVERFEGVDFQGALRQLGERAGVPVVFEGKEKREARNTLYDLLETATQFFESNMKRNAGAEEYLRKRGLSQETIAKFRIGYVEDKWNTLFDFLKERGYTDADIERAGLIKKGEKGYYDRFRGRIMFPISDAAGHVIAFSGRLFPDRDEGGAKYINSPETVLFNKSKTLYGLHRAKTSIRKANFSIVVEGQMDVVLSHQSGFPNTVALSGTALTAEHVRALKRLSSNIVFAFDADSAGVASSGKSAALALASGMDVKVAHIPEGTDPADLAKDDPEKLKQVIRESVHIINFYLSVLRESEPDRRKRARKIESTVLPFVARIESSIDRMHFVGEVARALDVPEEIVLEEVRKITVQGAPIEDEESVGREAPGQEELNEKERVLNHLSGIIKWQEAKKGSVIDVSDVKKEMKSIIGAGDLAKRLEDLGEFNDEALFYEDVYTSDQWLQSGVHDDLVRLKMICIREKQGAIKREIRDAEAAHNETLVKEKLIEFDTLSKELGALSK